MNCSAFIFYFSVGVIPLQLNATRTWAVVYVSGVQNPKADDWIGLFSLPDDVSTIDACNHAPVKLKVNQQIHVHIITQERGVVILYLI